MCYLHTLAFHLSPLLQKYPLAKEGTGTVTARMPTQNSYLEHPDNSQKPSFVMRESFLNLTPNRSMGHGLGRKANWPPWCRKNMPSHIWPGVRKMRLSGDPVRTGSRNRKQSALFHPRVGGWCEEERGRLANMPSLFSLLGWNLEVENWSKCPHVFEEAENTVVMADDVVMAVLWTEKKIHDLKFMCFFFLSVDWLIDFWCAVSSSLHGLFSSCGEPASHRSGFSHCGAQALGHAGFSGCNAGTQDLRLSGSGALAQ